MSLATSAQGSKVNERGCACAITWKLVVRALAGRGQQLGGYQKALWWPHRGTVTAGNVEPWLTGSTHFMELGACCVLWLKEREDPPVSFRTQGNVGLTEHGGQEPQIIKTIV